MRVVLLEEELDDERLEDDEELRLDEEELSDKLELEERLVCQKSVCKVIATSIQKR